MKAQKVEEPTRCPCCDEVYSALEGDVAEQHAPEALAAAWACGECETVFEDRDEAKECCR